MPRAWRGCPEADDPGHVRGHGHGAGHDARRLPASRLRSPPRPQPRPPRHPHSDLAPRPRAGHGVREDAGGHAPEPQHAPGEERAGAPALPLLASPHPAQPSPSRPLAHPRSSPSPPPPPPCRAPRAPVHVARLTKEAGGVMSGREGGGGVERGEGGGRGERVE